jgi:predicted secreted protein
MSEALIGWDAEFWLDNASGTLTQIAEVTAITPPNPQTDTIEVTNFKSAGRRREYIAGLIEDGEGTFEMNLVPGSASDVLLRAAQADGVVRSYRLILPTSGDGWQIDGECIVTGYERSIPIDDRMTATVTVRFTGANTEAAVA